MRILYVAAKYDYGKIEQGLSFEHYNFYEFFRRSGHHVTYFDSVGSFERLGREAADRCLLELVEAERPELMFSVLFTEELNPSIVRHISENNDTVTLNWFCDDHWRFEDYSQYWAPCFNWVATTARSAIEKYEQIGYRNAIKSQWGCNQFLYRDLDLPPRFDVSFVGQPHGDRRRIIGALRKAGIEVDVFGTGWGSGRIAHDEMIRVFNQSRINLNLSNASVASDAASAPAVRPPAWLLSSLERVPFGASIRQHARAFADRVAGAASGSSKSVEYVQQIKARTFEVPGCGGFLLTEKAEDLQTYYDIGTEIACFDGTRDLVDKIKYYLAHEDERMAIAQAGYARTLRDHTYGTRFEEIFSQMGLERA
jgi:spore maturation protein CgeB